MGHTIPPKRQIIYSKLNELKRFASTLREPYRSRLKELVESVYENISSIIFTNSLDDDEMILYAMLVQKSKNLNMENKEKIFRCISILISD